MILFRRHGKLTQIVGLPQHLSQVALAGNPLIIFSQGQPEDQHIFQGLARQLDHCLCAGVHHTHEASPPPMLIVSHLLVASFISFAPAQAPGRNHSVAPPLLP